MRALLCLGLSLVVKRYDTEDAQSANKEGSSSGSFSFFPILFPRTVFDDERRKSSFLCPTRQLPNACDEKLFCS